MHLLSLNLPHFEWLRNHFQHVTSVNCTLDAEDDFHLPPSPQSSPHGGGGKHILKMQDNKTSFLLNVCVVRAQMQGSGGHE